MPCFGSFDAGGEGGELLVRSVLIGEEGHVEIAELARRPLAGVLVRHLYTSYVSLRHTLGLGA